MPKIQVLLDPFTIIPSEVDKINQILSEELHFPDLFITFDKEEINNEYPTLIIYNNNEYKDIVVEDTKSITIHSIDLIQTATTLLKKWITNE